MVAAITGASAVYLVAFAFCAAGAVAGYRSGGLGEPFFWGMGLVAVVMLLFAFEVLPPE